MISIHKLSTNLSSKEAQILNKMELIKTTTDMVEFLHEKTFRNRSSGFVGICKSCKC